MLTWQEGDVLTNGIRLHYYRSGGDGPPIVLAHGITDSGMCWPMVSDALASGYDVVAVDARGHGKSEKPVTGYTRADHAADLAGLIEGLGLGRPLVMGHSMGAATASMMAATYPQIAAALILEDPPWRSADDLAARHERAATWAQDIAERKALSREARLQKGRADHPTWPEAVFDPWVDAKEAVSPNVFSFVAGDTLAWQDVVERIQCVTLLLTGDPELGAIVTPEIAADVQAANPCIEVANIPGAGHNIRRENYPAYMEAVNAFLDKHYPSK